MLLRGKIMQTKAIITKVLDNNFYQVRSLQGSLYNVYSDIVRKVGDNVLVKDNVIIGSTDKKTNILTVVV